MYATVDEFIQRYREMESLDQSNDLAELTINRAFIESYLVLSSARIDGVISVRYKTPVTPAPPLLNLICIRFAWWEMELQGDIRETVQTHYEQAEKWLDDLALGVINLTDADGVPIPAIGGDAVPGSAIGYSSGRRTATAYDGTELRLFG